MKKVQDLIMMKRLTRRMGRSMTMTMRLHSAMFDKCKMEELMEALKKVKADKKVKAELTVKSPFTKRVRESPLPRIYRG